MKRAGKKTFATFLLPPSLSPFFPSSFCPFFSGTLLGGGAQAPQAPPPPWVRP